MARAGLADPPEALAYVRGGVSGPGVLNRSRRMATE